MAAACAYGPGRWHLTEPIIPIDLPYAPARRRKFWSKRVVRPLCLVGVVLLGWYVQANVRGRIAALAAHPYAGPIDWGCVVQSPSLLRLAWWLSSSPRNMRDFLKGSETPGGIVLFGANPEYVKFGLSLPLHYADGQLAFSLEIKNASSKRVLVPPLRYLRSRRPDVIDPPPLMIECSAESAWLSRAAQILEPGKAMRCDFAVPAPESPVLTWIKVATLGQADPGASYDGANQFRMSIGKATYRLKGYRSWSDVDASVVETEVVPVHVRLTISMPWLP